MGKQLKAVTWLHCEIKTPPFSEAARIEAGKLIRSIQLGKKLDMPDSRPMPVIGPHCHELRIEDENKIWRIIYRIDVDFIVIADVFSKKTQKTPVEVIKVSKLRLRMYNKLFLEK